MQKISVLLLTLLFINTLLACGKVDVLANTDEEEKPVPLKGLEGKPKTVIQLTAQGNKISSQLNYNQETKEVSGIKITDSLAQSEIKETFTRNADGKITEATIERTANGVKTLGNRKYEYDANKLLVRTTEEFPNQKIVEDFLYNQDKQLIKYTRNQTQNNRTSLLQSISYKWKNGNVSAVEERGVMGYEETDFIYGSNPNNLGKVFIEQIKTPVYRPEQISQNLLTFQQKLFEGTRMKYEYEYNRDNRLVTQKSLVNDAKVAELRIEYY
ncbi:hypothetical protein [Emticicia agri]|uniref:DUF4595 domain-containing protein n=1 Tax=Emticicia agri TaxID=2492393 RepID=A0A4Q5M5U3_9BACT|nr:hypothetical protein [Emticicia agri]RYU97752.1 hypothetical protein EWM59_01125 [Emticicia agri]